MQATDIKNPEYFHKVVDCQLACPAHTPVPLYIRLIARERYADAYLVNWESNVFPGILGRTCDRPCEPACRRGRLSHGHKAVAVADKTIIKNPMPAVADKDMEAPVAICRLKRVAADNKGDIVPRLPLGGKANGKKIALIGAGPASLTVARDLLPLGYHIDLFDEQEKGGGMMRSQIPAFRLPVEVLEEEVDYVLRMGVISHFKHRVDSMKKVLTANYDAVFVGTGAPRGRDLNIAGRVEAKKNIAIGIEWLESVAFEHVKSIGKRVLVLGGGNTAMDCCRTASRLGGRDVKVIVRSPFLDMKASPWEKEDAQHEDVTIFDNHVPLRFETKNGKLTGMYFDKVRAEYDDKGKRSLISCGEPEVYFPCDDVLIAIGQENSFPWIERDIGIKFDDYEMPLVDKTTFGSSLPHVFFGGDAAFGPENIITAVAHGHQVAVSIDKHCHGMDVRDRLAPRVHLFSNKMGIHEWSYDNEISSERRYVVPQADKSKTLKDRYMEVELGFDTNSAYAEAQRCLNCDSQTVFNAKLCIECDACMDICPTNCISFVENAEESVLRTKLVAEAKNETQDLYVADGLKTKRVMVKDEDVCLHCGLCAERCPTSAWDMQEYLYEVAKTVEFDFNS